MNEAVGLLVSAIGLILVPVCLVRLVLGRADLAALYRAPAGDSWPPGVQEEDCPRWHLGQRRTAEAAGLEGLALVHGSAPVELTASTTSELADRDPRDHFVQPRAAVRAHVGLVG